MPAPRNGFKGYTYQQYIFTLFFAKMDTERKIKRIEAESQGTKQFDDLYVEMEDGTRYRIQIKNYPQAELDDINITDHFVYIQGNKNEYDPNDNNILVVKSDHINPNEFFMDLPAIKKSGITIIPLMEENVEDIIDSLYRSEKRELKIIHLGYAITCKAKFMVEKKDLPPMETIPETLTEKTIILRKAPDDVPKGITYIVGKPGVGKSHYVNELIAKYTGAALYRFWIDSQDDYLQERLFYKTFLDNLAIQFFESPRNFEEDELIEEINKGEKILIIDGLDHVENYQPLELSKYIEFIDKLVSGKVIVLSRPLKTGIPWEPIELLNWTYEETAKYLKEGHEINDYEIVEKIFNITDGYPVITFYVTNHYKIYNEIGLTQEIEDLNQYYDNLLGANSTNSLLTIFATNNSFYTEKELDELLVIPELVDAVKDFIEQYPYLFKRVENRISLLHDSLNTYLRGIGKRYPERMNFVNKIVKDSLRSENVEYMARMNSFMLETDFLDEMLIQYSNVECLERVLQKTIDIDSVHSFYIQLKNILEYREGLFNIYQYYSFALLFQVMERQNIMEYESLMFLVMKYIERKEKLVDCIYSSKGIWNLYLLLKGKHEKDYKRFLKRIHYDERHNNSVINNVVEQVYFFDKLDKKISNEEFEIMMQDAKDSLKKKECLTDYLVSVWINEEKQNEYYSIIQLFLSGEDKRAQNEFSERIKKYRLDKIWRESILVAVRWKLNELGLFGEENWFRKKSLKETIQNEAPKGSFGISDWLEAIIRLVNKDNRDIDIYSVNYFWIMYQQRKDYTVHSIDIALTIFEKNKQIEEMHSLKIIENLMAQSEKGIRHLMASYLNRKPCDFTKKLANINYFLSEECPLDIFDLEPDHLNCCKKEQIKQRLDEIMAYHRYSGSIEYNEVENLLHSNYKDILIDGLDFYDLSLWGKEIDKDSQVILEESGIRCLISKEEEKEPYYPFKYGCIHEEDEEYIIENKIGYMDIAEYTDGWDSCLPYVKLFLNYDMDDIRRDYLKIIHKAMFAKTVMLNRTGLWFLLLGNIPNLLNEIEIKVEWEKLYNIFLGFLKISMIWY